METLVDRASTLARADDLSRDVHCVLGMPIDAIDIQSVLDRIETARVLAAPFLISTPNLNFLVQSQRDPEFRESLLLSDLCPADGIAVVLVAQILGIPVNRVAGADIFEALKAASSSPQPLKVFLFGGAEGVAANASDALNLKQRALRCVGSLYPGYGTVDEVSRDDIIDEINSSEADMLVTALGAKNGQLWLLRNHRRLRIPIRVHLGAVVNFEAGTVKRAPFIVRRMGLEWLWRIKEEPQLWKRYWHDGLVLLRLLLTRVLPLIIHLQSLRLRGASESHDFRIKWVQDNEAITLVLAGAAVGRHIGKATSSFRSALIANKPIILDLVDTSVVDTRFLGLLLMLRKSLNEQGLALKCVGAPPQLWRLFQLNGLDCLLSGTRSA